MEWVFSHLWLSLGIWMASGYLGWAWLNYCAHSDNPEADKSIKKWVFFALAPLMGFMIPLGTLLICLIDRKWYFGLRFR